MKLPMGVFAAVLLAGTALAATTVTYPLPAGTVCNSVQRCQFKVTTPSFGLFQSGTPETQFDYLSSPDDQTPYNADYCSDGNDQPTDVWTVTNEPLRGPTAKLYSMSCSALDLDNVPSTLNASIHAHSYVQCHGSGRYRTCQTVWAIDSNSVLRITK